jgi:hypothetical protein
MKNPSIGSPFGASTLARTYGFCPCCGFSATPNEVLTVTKHFDAHALECIRCLYRTETKPTWAEAIALWNRTVPQHSAKGE